MCSVQQHGGRGETGTLGDLSTSRWFVFLRPDIDPPKAADQLVVQGLTLEFVGDCWPAYNGGHLDHLEGDATVTGP
jgi:hypothetical protein